MQTATNRKEAIIRHGVFLLIIAAAFGIIAFAQGIRVPPEQIKLYFIDTEMMRLLPVKTELPAMGKEKMAKRVLEELIEGHDDNPKIRRLLPKEKKCLTVKVNGNIAYVNIKKSVIENHPDGRDLELLTVYSIVNSLTAIDGITNVRFTVEGKVSRDFMGYVDMRETFIPDYFI